MMHRCLATVLVLTTVLHAASSLVPAGDVPMKFSWSHMRVPKWSHGALINVQYQDTNNPLIWIDDGNTQHAVPFSITGALSMLVYDYDRGTDGTLWLSGSATDSDGRTAGFVAWISADHINSLVIRTGQYRPLRIAAAPDGTLWSVGSESMTKTPSPDAAVIRRFDKSGRTVSSLIQQSTIAHVAYLEPILNSVRASSDRIAWYCVGFDDHTTGRYVEISLDGKLLTDISIHLPSNSLRYQITGFALSDEGDAFLSANTRGAGQSASLTSHLGAYVLDRSAGAWKPLLQNVLAPGTPPTPDYFDQILGVKDHQLVVAGYKTVKFYSIGK